MGLPAVNRLYRRLTGRVRAMGAGGGRGRGQGGRMGRGDRGRRRGHVSMIDALGERLLEEEGAKI